MSIELELFDPKKHENSRDEVNRLLRELDDDFQLSLGCWHEQDKNGTYTIVIGSVKESRLFEMLNHEVSHCVFGLLGEETAREKYNRVHYYVDWVHAGLETIDGKDLWERIIASRTECPSCGGVAEIVEEPDIFQCGKCGFLYNEESKKGWIELSESDVWEKFDIDPGYFKKLTV